MGKANTNAFAGIRVMDSTEINVGKNASDKYPGYGGLGREGIASIQFEYDLLSGETTQLSIGSSLDSDVKEALKSLNDIKKGTLLLRDMGYNSLANLLEYNKRGLYYISKVKPQWKLTVLIGQDWKVLEPA